MACFLGCFGPSKHRKRTKHKPIPAPAADQNPKSQKLLQEKEDDVSLVLSIKVNPSNSLPELRGKIEEPLNLSNRKKVTFDATVTTYEHVQVDDSTESLLERNEKGETFPKSGQTHSPSGSTEDADVKNVESYPPNYRYGNCVESEDEVDDDSDYEDANDDDEDEILCQEGESGIVSSYSNPVLKPVANLTQWKALKSNGTVTELQKENASLNSIQFQTKNPDQETAVDASLSNWLPSNKQFGCTTPTTVKSIEDRPILGALTVDELKQFSGSSCTPKKSPGRSPDDMPIIGSVGSYWSETGSSAQSLSPTSSYKGIPNTTSKYREDKKVKWHNTPFETRLERALNRDAAK